MAIGDIENAIFERFNTGYYSRCLELCNNNPSIAASEIIAQRCQLCLKQVPDAAVLCSLDSEDSNSRAIAFSKQIAELKKGKDEIPLEHVEMLFQSLKDFFYQGNSQEELLPESLTILADAYLQLGDHKSAIKLCSKNHFQTRAMELYIHLRMKNFGSAMEMSKGVFKQFNKSPTCLIACAYTKFSNGKWPEGFDFVNSAERALDSLDPMIVQQPDSLCFATAKAVGYMGMGDWQIAVEHLEQIKDDELSEGTSMANLVTCYWNLHDDAKAQETYKELESKFPNNTLVVTTNLITKCVENFEAKYCK